MAFLGLDKVVDQFPDNLPYGHQKALGVGMALATNPELLMLDEPAAGLNSEEASEMKQRIEKINELGASLIVVDHNMRFIMSLCHRIVVLDYGEMIAEGRILQKGSSIAVGEMDVHDGNGLLARHVGNAVTKVDNLGSRIVKDQRNSPRKIDSAVAMTIAVDRALTGRIEQVVPQFFV
jgi:ABC-type multidrug transport system ATPase subunit